MEVGRIAPGVVIEGEKITSLVGGAAVHILGGLITIRCDIGSGVAYRDLTVFAVSKVLFHIASDGLDIRGCNGGCGGLIDDLVAGKEGQSVGVFCKRVNGSEYALEIHIVVGWGRVDSIDRVKRAVDIEDEVDPSCGKSVHTRIMVH